MGHNQHYADLYTKLGLPLLSFIWEHRNALAVDTLVNAFNELPRVVLKLDRVRGKDGPKHEPELTFVFSMGPGRKAAGTLTYYPSSQQVIYIPDGSTVLAQGIEHVRICWFDALVHLAALTEVQVNQEVTL